MTENTAATEMTQSLNGDEWQIVYDLEGKRLFVRCTSEDKAFSINDFLAQRAESKAGLALQGLIIDMFPPEEEAGEGSPLG
jgi:hypothetical protein